MNKYKIDLILHNIRSTHNVGSIFRTADGFGVNHIYITGYTPYPLKEDDDRLPYLSAKIDRQIHKTALGAESTIAWSIDKNVGELLKRLETSGYTLAALEQTEKSKPLNEFILNKNICLIVGNEIKGIDKQTLDLCDNHLEIPMVGQKESFNVAVAAALALYQLKFGLSG